MQYNDMHQHALQGQLIVLDPVGPEDVELIRNWRNSPEVSRNFIFRQHITKAKQWKWYKKIAQSTTDFYYVIKLDDQKIGLSETKNITWATKVGEGGIFIAKQRYKNVVIPIDVTVTRLDFSFNDLGLKKIVSQVLSHNKGSLRLCQLLGYRKTKESRQTIDGTACRVEHLELHRLKYVNRAKTLKELIRRYKNDPSQLKELITVCKQLQQ